METIVTRDTEIFREYLAALETRDRQPSLFGRIASNIKLAQLRRELGDLQQDPADEETESLMRQIDGKLNQTAFRRFQARPWGSRLSIFAVSVLGQQVALVLVLLATGLFAAYAPKPGWWNAWLPHEQPIFLYAFILVFFCAAPLLALGIVFGGRYFSSWRKTVPATLAILVLGLVGTWLATRGKPMPPFQDRASSLNEFCRQRGVERSSYDEWLESNWLLKDAPFRADYETFLRLGPGRWITARFEPANDAAWRDALPLIGAYLDGGQDQNSFRAWLGYYLGRSRIYSEERLEEEVAALTSPDNERFLGIWQVEPYLKERDERIYRAYMGSVNRSTKLWGLLFLGLFAAAFLFGYLLAPVSRVWKSATGRFAVRKREDGNTSITAVEPLRNAGYSFPERQEITTPPFFDTPFKLLSRVHRIFLRRAILTSVVVFAFWGLVYAVDLSAGRENVASQIDFMRDYLLVGGPSDPGFQRNASIIETGDSLGLDSDGSLVERVSKLEQRADDSEYDNAKKLEKQGEMIEAQQAGVESVRTIASQLEPLPEQVNELSSRTGAAASRAEQLAGEVSAARQQSDAIDKKVGAKLDEFETKTSRTAEQVGRVEDETSTLATRTESLEKELDRRAGQIEAQTEELGNRTVELKAREERLDQLQRIAFTAILAGIKADVQSLDGRTNSVLYRLFRKGDARRDAEGLRQRIAQLAGELEKIESDEAKQVLQQLGDLKTQLDKIAARLD